MMNGVHRHLRWSAALCPWAMLSLAVHLVLIGGLTQRFQDELPEAFAPRQSSARLVGSSFEVQVEVDAPDRKPAPAASSTDRPSSPTKDAPPVPYSSLSSGRVPAQLATSPRSPSPRRDPSPAVPPISAGRSSSRVPRPPVKSTFRDASAPPSASDVLSPPTKGTSDSVSTRTPSVPTSSSTVASSAGPYGVEGKREALSQLRRAFIKTLPLAAKLDPIWLSLKSGDLGSFVLRLSLDEHGRLETVEAIEGEAHPALLRAAVKNRVFLGSRRFLIGASSKGGTLDLRLGGAVSSRDPSAAGAENNVVALGVRIDPRNRNAEPKGAYFTFDSGLHVELRIQPVP